MKHRSELSLMSCYGKQVHSNACEHNGYDDDDGDKEKPILLSWFFSFILSLFSLSHSFIFVLRSVSLSDSNKIIKG